MELIYEYLRWRQLMLPGEFAMEVGSPVLLFSRKVGNAATSAGRTMTGRLKMAIEVHKLLNANKLKLRGEAHEMRVFRVRPRPDGRTTLRIGRGTDNDLVVNQASISKHHADLVLDSGAVRVIDQESKNGTNIDGVEIAAPTLLVPGQTLTLGNVPMRYLEPVQLYDALTALTEAS